MLEAKPAGQPRELFDAIHAPRTAIKVTPASATQLVLTSQPPANVLVSTLFGFTVKAEDDFGNVDTNFAGSVSLKMLSNPGGATLGGTTSLTANKGVADFSNLLTLDQAGSPDTIQASAGGLASATTNPFSANFSVPVTTANLSGTLGNAG